VLTPKELAHLLARAAAGNRRHNRCSALLALLVQKYECADTYGEPARAAAGNRRHNTATRAELGATVACSVYLHYQYKSTNTDTYGASAKSSGQQGDTRSWALLLHAQCTCITSTKVQILTPTEPARAAAGNRRHNTPTRRVACSVYLHY
jgi:hypothetical protein